MHVSAEALVDRILPVVRTRLPAGVTAGDFDNFVRRNGTALVAIPAQQLAARGTGHRSRRRAALDTAYAVEHPIRPAREGKDPTERLQPREPRKKPPTSGGWTHYAHDDEAPDADPIERPSRAVLARVKAGNLRHDPGAGTFLGRTLEAFHGFTVGSLIFREPEDNAGFYLHAPLEEAVPKPRAAGATTAPAAATPSRPTRAPKPQAPAAPMGGGDVDAAKDKALLDAFSQAIASAMATS
jgi:hypothetical protein